MPGGVAEVNHRQMLRYRSNRAKREVSVATVMDLFGEMWFGGDSLFCYEEANTTVAHGISGTRSPII